MKDNSFIPLFYLSSFSNPFAKRRRPPGFGWPLLFPAKDTAPIRLSLSRGRIGRALYNIYCHKKIPKVKTFGIFIAEKIT